MIKYEIYDLIRLINIKSFSNKEGVLHKELELIVHRIYKNNYLIEKEYVNLKSIYKDYKILRLELEKLILHIISLMKDTTNINNYNNALSYMIEMSDKLTECFQWLFGHSDVKPGIRFINSLKEEFSKNHQIFMLKTSILEQSQELEKVQKDYENCDDEENKKRLQLNYLSIQKKIDTLSKELNNLTEITTNDNDGDMFNINNF